MGTFLSKQALTETAVSPTSKLQTDTIYIWTCCLSSLTCKEFGSQLSIINICTVVALNYMNQSQVWWMVQWLQRVWRLDSIGFILFLIIQHSSRCATQQGNNGKWNWLIYCPLNEAIFLLRFGPLTEPDGTTGLQTWDKTLKFLFPV